MVVADGATSDWSLAGRGVVICGQDCALMEALELEAEARGARVAALSIDDSGRLKSGDQVVAGRIEDDVEGVFEAVCGEMGRLDGLVVLQSPLPSEPFLRTSTATWWKGVSRNLRLPFVLDRCAVDEFLAEGGGGSLVHVCCRLPADRSGLAIPAACTHGIAGLSRTFMKEMGRRQIRSNTVRVDSRWLAACDGASAEDARESAVAALYLVSDAASFVTGNDLSIGPP